ncbi:hypothetical protein SLEP1_g35734 [Rubroshorea leprosula]|uniref:Reverse transcriptase Ty1/copia-type domain-containing protein n=1 Tax=Rubroshorea leprosula TaxID=152421 RepID=A0AAV5KPB8_9ROSI|nr:hypothetical protein SLEP1_g35734 [Rubroshorea leprosula]
MANESSATITSPFISTNVAIPIRQNTIITFNAAAHFPLKLIPSNYPSWQAQFLSILTIYKLTGFLNGSKPCPPAPIGEVPDSPFELWICQDQLILHAILTLVLEPIAPYISAIETSQQAWKTLANLYANHSRSRVFTLKERLQNTRRESHTVFKFLHQLKVLVDELAAIDKPLTNDDLMVYVLNEISLEFREISASIRAQDEPLSFEELHDSSMVQEFCHCHKIYNLLDQANKWHEEEEMSAKDEINSTQKEEFFSFNSVSALHQLSFSFSFSFFGTGLNSILCSSPSLAIANALHHCHPNSVGLRHPDLIGCIASHCLLFRSSLLALLLKYFPLFHYFFCCHRFPFLSLSLSLFLVPVLISSLSSASVSSSPIPPPPSTVHYPPNSPHGLCQMSLMLLFDKGLGIWFQHLRIKMLLGPGHNYSNTFSLVIKPTTICTMFTIAVSLALPIWQLDVNNAFLHGSIEDDLYMAQSAGFIDQTLPHHVYKLKKAIYGLKQAPRAWCTKLKKFLLACGLVNSRSDCSLFIHNNARIVIYVLVYVDDIFITNNNTSFISYLINKLGEKFSLKDLGELNLFLGVEAIKTSAGLFLSQHRYINDLLQKSKMDGAKTVATPMSSLSLSPHNGSPTLFDAIAYRKLVGSLQYLSSTRPDISFVVNKLSQYMHCPTELHWQAVKHILRYLKGTMFHGLLIRSSSNLALHAFSDSDWAGDKDTFASTTGYLVFLGATPISWKASKQKAIARTSTEAEYRALAAISFELVWVLHLLSELGLHFGNPPVLYCDNVGATYLISNPVMHSRMKHIAIDLHFIRDLVDKRILRVYHIASADQLADGLTKPLSSFCFALLCSKIGVIDGSTILRGRIKETLDTAQSIMPQSHKGYQD